MSEPTREERIAEAVNALQLKVAEHAMKGIDDWPALVQAVLDAAGVWTLLSERDRLRKRAESLQRVVNGAYDAAMEFGDNPQQALVCVVEWLEPVVSEGPGEGTAR